jgi:Tol biopolymer transport system component
MSVDFSTGTAHALIATSLPLRAASLSSDGKTLALVNPATTAVDIYTMDPMHSSKSAYRFSTSTGADGAAFTADGSLIVRTKTGFDAYVSLAGATKLPAAISLTMSAAH